MGLGTWLSKPGEVSQAVAVALKSGYKHIDCAAVYQNEPEVRAGLKEAFDAGIKREGIFHLQAFILTIEGVASAVLHWTANLF